MNILLACLTKTNTNMAHKFKPNVGKKVSKTDAQDWIDKYDKHHRHDKDHDTKSIFYGRDALLKLLAAEESTGITFFLALRPDEDTGKDRVQLVLFPTREDGSIIEDANAAAKSSASSLVSTASVKDDTSGPVDNGLPCPPACS